MVGDNTSLITDVVVDVLQAILAEELVSGFERNLDDCAELGELFGGIVLDVCDAFKVGDELLGDGLPGGEALDEDVTGFQLVWRGVLLDERLVARHS